MILSKQQAGYPASLNQKWDIIVIGGGITGAGVFRRAVSAGLRTLLVEANDFASGTSSRSSKLVHGGFRYLRNGQFDITRESVRERQKILQEANGLVDSLGFILPFTAARGQKATFRAGVRIYDLMAHIWKHRLLSINEIREIAPLLDLAKIAGAFLYYDAKMDDARMVMRLLEETVADGGTALNYTRVEQLLRTQDGQVCGVVVRDQSPADLGSFEIQAQVVINATGPWSDQLRAQVNGAGRIRPLRGSHLIFPRELLPLSTAVTMLHPQDGRAMFSIPWEGTTMIGTTDLDHPWPIDQGEPFCTQAETDYILAAAAHYYPSAGLTQDKIISSFAGLRPIVRGDASDPSAESRRHVVMEEDGLITITGGKLTIFRIMAEDAFQQAAPRFGRDFPKMKRYFKALPNLEGMKTGGLDAHSLAYLLGRYGNRTPALMESVQADELTRIESLPNVWAELRFAAQSGSVEHLDDLLLRRVRLGMLLPDGASALLPRIRALTQTALGWDDPRWLAEESRYLNIYQRYYSKAPRGSEY